MRMRWRSASEFCWSLWLSSSGLKSWANAIRLYGEVVAFLVRQFRSLCVDAIVEPMCLFVEVSGDRSNQRPDILRRNPRGFGGQIILGVAIMGVDGQSRTSDDLPKRPLQVRCDKKVAKYGQIAWENTLRFAPAVSSHTGQIHVVFLREQIHQKLSCFGGTG